MISVTDVSTGRQKRVFVDFVYRLYAGQPCYKDTLMPVLKLFLGHGDTFTAQAFLRPIQIWVDGVLSAQCILVHHPRLPLLQVAFFEALPARESAVRRLVEEARVEARRRGLPRIVAGLNGHVAYGVGFLADAYDLPCSFDSLYSPPYYLPYWSAYADTVRTLTTYRFTIGEAILPEPVLRRAAARFRYRRMDKSRFEQEAVLLGELANRCLAQTHLYFPRDPFAMYQLLRSIRPLLRSEHLVFACRDGREVGFLFWHPDFNEVVPGGRRNSDLMTGLRCLLGGDRIRNAKLNAVGVEPRYQGSAAVIGLLGEMVRSCAARYDSVETNFVWDSNRKSTLLNAHFPHREARHYKTFELAASA
jgi:hypothetical protein